MNGTFEAALTDEPVIDGEFWLICGQRRELSEMKNDSWFSAAGLQGSWISTRGVKAKRKRGRGLEER